MIRTLVMVVFSLFATSASATGCTEYERTVFAMIEEAKAFQQSQGFKEFGWSSTGPTNGWLERMQALQQGDVGRNSVHFFGKHGFGIEDVYQVTDEYRTSGSLDSYYQGIENAILSAEPCK